MRISPTKLLICGKTASGKRFLAKLLTEKLDLKIAKSITTKQPYSNNNSDHIFVDEESFSKQEHNNKLFCITEYNGCRYALTEDEIKKSDIIILDPLGVNDILNAFPEIMFRIVYVRGTNEDQRKNAYLQQFNTNDRDSAETAYSERSLKEEKLFKFFDNVFVQKSEKINKDNVHVAYTIENNYTDKSDIFSFANLIAEQMTLMLRSAYILSDLIEANKTDTTILSDMGMQYDAEKNILTVTGNAKTEDGSTERGTWQFTPEDIVEQMTTESTLFFNIMTTWLSLPNRLTVYNGFNHIGLCL